MKNFSCKRMNKKELKNFGHKMSKRTIFILEPIPKIDKEDDIYSEYMKVNKIINQLTQTKGC